MQILLDLTTKEGSLRHSSQIHFRTAAASLERGEIYSSIAEKKETVEPFGAQQKVAYVIVPFSLRLLSNGQCSWLHKDSRD